MHLFYYIFFIEVILASFFYFSIHLQTNASGNSTCPKECNFHAQQVYLLIAFSVIFVFHAFRDPISLPDIPFYKMAFEESLKYSAERVIDEGFVDLKSEVGFRIIVKLISELFSSYVWLFIITSGFVIYSFYNATKRYSHIYWVSVLVFVVSHYANSLFMLRAYLAIGILLFSFPFIIQRKLIPYLLLNVLAMSVHMTAIVFLPVYFIYGIKNKLNLSLFLLVFGITMLLTFNGIVNFFVERVFSEYAYYLLKIDNYEGASWKVPAMIGSVLILRLAIFRNSFFNEGTPRLLSILCVLAFIVYTAGMGFGLTSRIALFYTNMTFLILPDTISRIKSQGIKYSIAILYISFNGYFFLNNSAEELWRNYRLYDFL